MPHRIESSLLVADLINYVQHTPGITRQKVASLSGVNPSHLSQILTGKFPHLQSRTIKKLAAVIGQPFTRYGISVSPEELNKLVAGVHAYDMPNNLTYMGRPENGMLRDAFLIATERITHPVESPIERLRNLYLTRPKASISTFEFNPQGHIAHYDLEARVTSS